MAKLSRLERQEFFEKLTEWAACFDEIIEDSGMPAQSEFDYLSSDEISLELQDSDIERIYELLKEVTSIINSNTK